MFIDNFFGVLIFGFVCFFSFGGLLLGGSYLLYYFWYLFYLGIFLFWVFSDLVGIEGLFFRLY